MKKLQFLAFSSLLLLPLAASAAVLPLPTPATITVDNTYTVPTDRGQSYNLNLKGTFAGATVSLQYFNPSGQTWDEMQSFTAPLSGFVHIAGNNEARLIVTGSTGTTSISAELFASAPLIPARPAVGSDGASSLIVQEKDGMIQTDTLAALNATSAVRECTGYKSVTIQVTAVGVGGATAPEVSNDGVNWLAVTGYQTNNIGNTAPTLSFSPGVGVTVVYPTPAKFFRIRQASWTSGAFTYISCFKSAPIPIMGLYLSQGGGSAVSVQGTSFNGVGVQGAPVRIGGRTRTALALLTAADQASDLIASSCGQLITKPYAPAESDWSYCPPANGITGSTTPVVIKAAAGAGLKNYITSATLMTNGPMGSATEFVILDGVTPIFRLQIGTAGVQAGIDIDFPTPLRSSANAALSIQSTINTTGAILCNLQGYIAP